MSLRRADGFRPPWKSNGGSLQGITKVGCDKAGKDAQRLPMCIRNLATASSLRRLLDTTPPYSALNTCLTTLASTFKYKSSLYPEGPPSFPLETIRLGMLAPSTSLSGVQTVGNKGDPDAHSTLDPEGSEVQAEHARLTKATMYFLPERF